MSIEALTSAPTNTQRFFESSQLTSIAFQFCDVTDLRALSEVSRAFKALTPSVLKVQMAVKESATIKDFTDCRRFLKLDSITEAANLMHHLEVIDLKGSSSEQQMQIFQSTACKSWKKIKLATALDENHLLSLFRSCPNLEYVSLFDCPAISDESLFALAEHCPALRKIEVDSSRITPCGVSAILKNCSLLEGISLYGCRGISAEGFVEMGKYCQKLTSLDLRHTAIDNEGIRSIIAHNSVLTFLDLAHTNVEARTLVTLLPALKNLYYLSLYLMVDLGEQDVIELLGNFNKLKHLILSYTLVGNPVIMALPKLCAELEKVELNGCLTTNREALSFLVENCKKLNRLTLYNCPQFSFTDVSTLKSLKADLKVFHSASQSSP